MMYVKVYIFMYILNHRLLKVCLDR